MMNFHPYTLLVGFVLLVTTAAGSLFHRTPTPVVSTPTSWNSTSVPLGYTPSVNASDTTVAPTETFKIGSTLPTFTFAVPQVTQNTPDKNVSSITSYLKQSDKGATIPIFDVRTTLQGTTAAPASTNTPSETQEQQFLHMYGNTAGGIVHTLDIAHPNANNDLTAFFKDPSDATAVPVIQISNDLIQAGAALSALNAVPSEVLDLHQHLAQAYTDAGNKLAAVATLRNSSDIASAIDAYNTSAEAVGEACVAIVLMYKDQKIQFTSSEPGSIFMFSGAL